MTECYQSPHPILSKKTATCISQIVVPFKFLIQCHAFSKDVSFLDTVISFPPYYFPASCLILSLFQVFFILLHHTHYSSACFFVAAVIYVYYVTLNKPCMFNMKNHSDSLFRKHIILLGQSSDWGKCNKPN